MTSDYIILKSGILNIIILFHFLTKLNYLLLKFLTLFLFRWIWSHMYTESHFVISECHCFRQNTTEIIRCLTNIRKIVCERFALLPEHD